LKLRLLKKTRTIPPGSSNLHLLLFGVFLSFVLFLYVPSVLADSVDRAYQKAAKKYYLLYKDTPFRDKEDNWLKTISQFERIYKNHPNHSKAHKALFNIGNLYRSLYKWNHKQIYIDRSNISFRNLVNEYPKSNLVDNSQFNIAENYEVYKKDKNLAYIEYNKLIEQFPKSFYTAKAKKKISSLGPPNKDLQILPVTENAITPIDLTRARFGGLSEEEDKISRPLILVSKVDYWSTSDWSRMVVNIKDDVRYKYQVLKEDKSIGKGKRMYIDIHNAFIPKKFKKKIAANDGLIKQARIAQYNKSTVRIVLDLASLKRIKVFHFKLPNQYKIVVDILGQSAINGLKGEFANAVPKKQTKKNNFVSHIKPGRYSADQNAISLSKALGLKVKRIILDPGHGGRDPGASAYGLKEKDITLKIGHTLKTLIQNKYPDIEVLMTREKDRYLSLEARTAFANKYKGDLFISIHFNASKREHIRGIETYFLNLTTDNDALELAAKENQTSLKSISQLQNILNDLMTNSKIQESSLLAENIQTSLIKGANNSKMIRQRNLGVKQAPFFVLLGAEMPSVLVEFGFITNKKENRLIKNKEYRAVLVEGIFKGIESYMN